MEGVMMKNLDRYAVAVRKPDHEIEVMTDEYKSLGSRYAVLGLPIIRGVVNFGESLYIGLKTLSYSSSFYEEEDYEPGKVEQFFTKIFGDKLESVLMGNTMVISVILALGIFMVLPFFLTNLMKGFLPSYSIRTLIEGIIRVALFLIYMRNQFSAYCYDCQYRSVYVYSCRQLIMEVYFTNITCSDCSGDFL